MGGGGNGCVRLCPTRVETGTALLLAYKLGALNGLSDNVGAVLMGEGLGIQEGSTVKATGKIASVPVGDESPKRFRKSVGLFPMDDDIKGVKKPLCPVTSPRQGPVSTGNSHEEEEPECVRPKTTDPSSEVAPMLLPSF